MKNCPSCSLTLLTTQIMKRLHHPPFHLRYGTPLPRGGVANGFKQDNGGPVDVDDHLRCTPSILRLRSWYPGIYDHWKNISETYGICEDTLRQLQIDEVAQRSISRMRLALYDTHIRALKKAAYDTQTEMKKEFKETTQPMLHAMTNAKKLADCHDNLIHTAVMNRIVVTELPTCQVGPCTNTVTVRIVHRCGNCALPSCACDRPLACFECLMGVLAASEYPTYGQCPLCRKQFCLKDVVPTGLTLLEGGYAGTRRRFASNTTITRPSSKKRKTLK